MTNIAEATRGSLRAADHAGDDDDREVVASRSAQLLDAFAGQWRMVPVLLSLAAIWVYFWSQNSLFLSSRNLSNLSVQVVVTSILALGLFFVLVVGEIDLSVAVSAAVSAAVAANMAVNHAVNVWLAIAMGIVVGALIGAVQGLIVSLFRAPSFIVTLGGSLILTGVLLQMLPADSNLISLLGNPMSEIANSYLPNWLGLVLLAFGVAIFGTLRTHAQFQRERHALGGSRVRTVLVPTAMFATVGLGVVLVLNSYRGVPLPVAILLGLLALFGYVTTQTAFGVSLYAIGANREAARRAGIPVARIRIGVFMLTGMLAAVAGIIAASRVLGVSSDSADPTLLLEAIAAAVIGGVSLFGGRGSVWAPLIGTLVIQSISNGMLLVDATTQARLEVEGGILILAVVVDASLSRRNFFGRG